MKKYVLVSLLFSLWAFSMCNLCLAYNYDIMIEKDDILIYSIIRENLATNNSETSFQKILITSISDKDNNTIIEGHISHSDDEVSWDIGSESILANLTNFHENPQNFFSITNICLPRGLKIVDYAQEISTLFTNTTITYNFEENGIHLLFAEQIEIEIILNYNDQGILKEYKSYFPNDQGTIMELKEISRNSNLNIKGYSIQILSYCIILTILFLKTRSKNKLDKSI